MKQAQQMKGRLQAVEAASLSHLLIRTSRLLYEYAVLGLQRSGHHGVRVAHTSLLPHLVPEGIRTTELARRLGVSKQAVSQLVSDLEAEGYLERRGDPDDGRAKRVHMTARGYEIQIVGLGLMSEFERGLADALGDEKLAGFRQGAEAARHWLQVCLEAERSGRK
jgi:DNA-binding MarR family transcriptional regulator